MEKTRPFNFPKVRVGIGQDSHRFLHEDTIKNCMIGGLIFEGVPGLDADSDGDVVLHAICNAISSVTGVPILGGVAIEMCQRSDITDSKYYLKAAIDTLGAQKVEHVALTIEAYKPRLQKRIQEMRAYIAELMQLDISQVGITCTSGDGLTDFGRGVGLQCICVITTIEG